MVTPLTPAYGDEKLTRDYMGGPTSPYVPKSRPMDDGFAQVEKMLTGVGLASLIPKMTALIVQHGALTTDQLSLWMRDQDEFKDRFPALFQGDGSIKSITPGGDLAAQVQAHLNYESDAKELLQRTGMGKFIAPDEASLRTLVTEAIQGDVSSSEFQNRVVGGYMRVSQADPSIRQYFADEFGADGDAALAAFFTDPQRAEPEMMRQVEAAEIGGTLGDFGFNVSGERALELGQSVDVQNQGQARDLARQAGQMKSLTNETISEATDLTEDDALGVVFGGKGQGSAEELFRRRLEGRAAAFKGGGGAAASQQGVIGLGKAR